MKHTNFTFMIKTLLRPEALARLLPSIRKFYPDTPIWIADDSPEPYPEVAEGFGNVQYHTFDYDIGIGHCYNWMIDRIETPYIVLLDDDFVFTRKTMVHRFIPWLKGDVFDLVGGAVYAPQGKGMQGFVGFFTQPNTHDHGVLSDKTIRLRKVPYETVGKGIKQIEITMNFFGAKTDVLRQVRWDEELKVCRHEDWFLRFNGYRPRLPKVEGFKAGYYPSVVVNHENRYYRNTQYRALRSDRFNEFRKVFIRKWGFEFK